MKTSATTQHKQRGLTLVEIMVALTISSLLVAGVIQIFASNKSTYRLQEGLGRMQENARFALDFMSRDIRQAGYMGCIRSIENVQNSLINPPASFSPNLGLQGWEFTGGVGTAPNATYDLNATDALPANATTGNSNGWTGWTTAAGDAIDVGQNANEIRAVSGSDILRVWHGAADSSQVTRMTPGNAGGAPTFINTRLSNAVNAGDIVLVSDCVAADWMQVCNVANAGGGTRLTVGAAGGNCGLGNNLANKPATRAANSEVIPLRAGIYFIGKLNNAAQSPPSLYYMRLNNNGTAAQREELIQGVDNMQILYGEDTDADGQANRYRTANQVANWRNVSAVKIGLLMRTVKEVDTQQSHGGIYNVNGTNINLVVNDRRPRKVFTTTIQLRNRSS